MNIMHPLHIYNTIYCKVKSIFSVIVRILSKKNNFEEIFNVVKKGIDKNIPIYYYYFEFQNI